MAKRVVVKPGDIFCIELEDNTKCYFQNLGEDSEQLNGNVIRVFKKKYYNTQKPTFDEIISDPIDFHALTYINWGVKLEKWFKVGKAMINKDCENIYFKTIDEDDEGKKIWDVWRVNKRGKSYKNNITKKLYEKAEWGLVFSADAIINKINHGYFRKYLDDIDKEYQNISDKHDMLSFFDIFKKKK